MKVHRFKKRTQTRVRVCKSQGTRHFIETIQRVFVLEECGSQRGEAEASRLLCRAVSGLLLGCAGLLEQGGPPSLRASGGLSLAFQPFARAAWTQRGAGSVCLSITSAAGISWLVQEPLGVALCHIGLSGK